MSHGRVYDPFTSSSFSGIDPEFSPYLKSQQNTCKEYLYLCMYSVVILRKIFFKFALPSGAINHINLFIANPA